MPLQVEPEKNMGKDERRFQSLPLGGRCSVSKKSAFYEAVRNKHRPCRGRCPHRPEKGREFAVNFREIGLFCRDDVGIVPYKRIKRSSAKTGKHVFRQSQPSPEGKAEGTFPPLSPHFSPIRLENPFLI